ncbi:N-acetyltransferase GCN5 [Sphingopyxis sp. LC81]|uniref:GNAT family N-acetyltransferase n=1 Tax=Sphingopyxis sp. LC81 TaxID=1502850 RepID=UPI00050F76CF|nr:GNAT family N-acetyltransferase [Sphingopyxis sp. LC81]KGB54473.1 N-acetyltransferase GCN5 [Sphingopyxis sp. LC81]
MDWRAMTDADLERVANLAEVVHLDYPENPSVFAACYRLYPAGCHVLELDDGRIGGYLISHPGRLDTPPVLDVPLERLPEPLDCYYLHDLALGEATRGHGMANRAVEIVVEEARSGGFDTIALIAVGDAHAFWDYQGFVTLGDGRIDPGKGYGEEARALIRKI